MRTNYSCKSEVHKWKPTWVATPNSLIWCTSCLPPDPKSRKSSCKSGSMQPRLSLRVVTSSTLGKLKMLWSWLSRKLQSRFILSSNISKLSGCQVSEPTLICRVDRVRSQHLQVSSSMSLDNTRPIFSRIVRRMMEQREKIRTWDELLSFFQVYGHQKEK